MKKLFILTLLIATILSGCANSDENHFSEYDENQGNQEEQVNQDNPDETTTLTFQTVKNEQEITEVTQIDAENVVKEQEVFSGKVISYTKPNDRDHVYGAYNIDDTFYELGVVGGLHEHPMDELISIESVELFDKSITLISGVFGANAPVQNYFSVVESGIAPFLRIETGHATEVDLDGDGTVEIVSSHGTPMETYIYQWTDEEFKIANVNDALGAISVHMNDENQFEAFFDTSNENQLFEYDAGVLTSISNEQK